MTNAIGSFDEFYRALYDGKRGTFPWQRRLAETVVATGVWPKNLDLPTGTGKTTVLEIAVYALAVDATRPVEKRRAARRILLVVDRRTVVDQAHETATYIANRLAKAVDEPGILGHAARALCGLLAPVPPDLKPAGPSQARPIRVAHLRGAIPRDDQWVKDPCQPVLGISTVDQVGSRLLFRGYGVSTGMRPVHAGILSHDTLVFLDEVHLARPFEHLLAAVKRFHGEPTGTPSLAVVSMSATPRPEVESAFGLADDDRADAVLGPRLTVARPAVLKEIKVSGDETKRRTAFADAVAALVAEQVKSGVQRVALVVNRVDTALAAFASLRASLQRAGDGGPPVFLITGRMRPIDREKVERAIKPLVGAGSERKAPGCVVVATQCIEAGADLDFDVLVTECASLDALVQRFGRLDRRGEYKAAHGIIAARGDHLGARANDLVYGEALSATWDYLGSFGSSLDVGRAEALRSGAPPACFTAPVPELTLTSRTLDLLSCTNATPNPDPSVALHLRGEVPGTPEVSIVWRRELDLPSAPNEPDLDRARRDELWLESIAVAPPLRREAVTVPIWAALKWLGGMNVAGYSDLLADQPREADDRRDAGVWQPVVAWDARGKASIVGGPEEFSAGLTLVVPSSYGGLRDGTFCPEATDPVSDLHARAHLEQRGRLYLRLRGVLGPHGAPPPRDSPAPAPFAALQQLARELTSEGAELQPSALRRVMRDLGAARRLADVVRANDPTDPVAKVLEDHADRLRLVLSGGDLEADETTVVRWSRIGFEIPGRLGVLTFDDAGLDTGADVPSDDDAASRTGVGPAGVSLAVHLKHVEHYAEHFARSFGLPPPLAGAIRLAARWHDVGKADPRFQRWLMDGDAVRAMSLTAPIAKSASKRRSRAERRRIRQVAGYPRGARHEILSVAMLERADALPLDGSDRDLVLHLVGAHHGWCRPEAPIEVVEASEVTSARVDVDGVVFEAPLDHGLAAWGAGIPSRFFRLTDRYGWWSLAWMEALVRLADCAASAAEEECAPRADMSEDAP
ncbi:MAG: type I-U CRISPR-associated helicase/endonuclease Cas3 [Kofleriaceae bacterium]|nr:type I-U CRISPR-associated helicase/endonuclease Cas3 [Kofleriaceae bacterium]MBP9856810.1 type I-U CRISPR-associated helicase/endonuclease Cas3 [Kofleriaceae bacterium]